MKYILRLIVLPLFASLALIGALRLWVMYIINYIRFGGEAVAFTHKMNPKTLTSLFEQVDTFIKSQK